MPDRESNQGGAGSGGLMIPMDNRVLGEFIAGLLGQSRLMERRFSNRRFEIDTNWLLNLDQIIDQRLASQNQAKLVSFSSRFYFANGKTITLEDHGAFRAFHDMSNELSVGVDLQWSYLIKFPLAKLPEKQEIRFSAFTDEDIAQQRPKERKEGKSFISTGDGGEFISIAIRFTDVTWGEDIYSHMGNYVLAKTESIPRFTSFLRKFKSTSVVGSAALIGMAVSMWSVFSLTSAGVKKVTQKFGSLDAPNLTTSDEKLDLLIGLAVARLNIDVFPFVPFIRGLFLIAILAGVYFLVTTNKASFININSYSDQHLKKYGKNYDFIKYGILVALLVGVTGGIFANKIYDLTRMWW